jgi:hypothetical protein
MTGAGQAFVRLPEGFFHIKYPVANSAAMTLASEAQVGNPDAFPAG